MSEPTDRDRKIQILQAIEERKRRRNRAPLLYLDPHAKQKQFFDAQHTHRGVIFSGGNRSGKTVANAGAIIEHAYGYRIHEVPNLRLTPDGDFPPRTDVDPKYWIRRPDGAPLRPSPSILAVTGLTFPKGIGRILWPEIENWLPEPVRGRLVVHRGPYGVPVSVAHPDGLWQIFFGSVEQPVMSFEGDKYDAVAFDEPPTRSHFEAIWRGMTDFYAPFWMAFTPLGPNAPWLYEEFWAGKREDVAIVEVCQEENTHLSAEALRSYIEGMKGASEEVLLARRRGRFGFLTHRAITNFDENVHVIEPFPIPRNWGRTLACDPANRRPFYFLWLAYDDRRETFIAYREFPFEQLHHTYRTCDLSVRDYATMLRNVEGEERVDCRVIDPRFGVAEYSIKGQKQTSVCDDFARFGLMFDPRVPDTAREETGLLRLRELLWYDRDQEIGEFNRPRLLIFNTCKSLIHACKNYTFVPPDRRDDRILVEKTTEAFKDPIDALRYGILYGPPRNLERAARSYIPEAALLEENEFETWL